MMIRQLLVRACFQWKLVICLSVLKGLISGHKGIFHPMGAVARCIFFNPLTVHMQLCRYTMHAGLWERWKVLASCFNFFFLHYIITQEIFYSMMKICDLNTLSLYGNYISSSIIGSSFY